MARLLSLTSSLLILTQSNHVVNGFVSTPKSGNVAFRVADAVNGPLRVTTLDEWEAERAERVRAEASVERIPPPPPNFDPTQFDGFADARGWSQNVNNPFYAAKVAAEHHLLDEKDAKDGIRYESLTEDWWKPSSDSGEKKIDNPWT